jgi:hypothetical protein
MLNYEILSRKVSIWSPFYQVNTIGSKVTLIQSLESIAEEITKSCRPQSRVLTPGEALPSRAVLKRSHSDCGGHVLFPDQPGRTWDEMRSFSPHIRAVWFAQMLVPELERFGEWRVFIIGGKPIYVVHTRYNKQTAGWLWEPVDSYYSLRELRSVQLAMHY